MSKILNFGVLGAFVTSTSLLAATPDVRLEPRSSWTVDYADDSCRLLRQFGDKADPLTVMFDKFAPSDWFQLSIVGKQMRRFSSPNTFDLQFGPQEQVQRLNYLSGTMGTKIPAIFLASSLRIAPLSKEEEAIYRKPQDRKGNDIAPIGVTREAAVNELRVGKMDKGQITFALGSMKAPFAALNTCLENLLGTWGVDPAKQKTASQSVKPLSSPENWLTWEDYPMDELSAGAQALVNFRLSVDATGKPTACHIQQSTRSRSFDTTVCSAMMRRAKFKPALDADGKPFASYYRNRVIFTMP
jgi:TonB family protein